MTAKEALHESTIGLSKQSQLNYEFFINKIRESCELGRFNVDISRNIQMMTSTSEKLLKDGFKITSCSRYYYINWFNSNLIVQNDVLSV